MPTNLSRLFPYRIFKPPIMEKFLSCDWGTSSFRLRLVEIASNKIITEDSSDQGIAKVFDSWREAGQQESLRFAFFLERIEQSIQSMEGRMNYSFDKYPLIISGMACSTLGMVELPYKDVPFSTDGSDLVTQIIAADNDFKHDIIFISGARTENDAMRGEETQLIGCIHNEQEQVYIFPGTHSKHVFVKNGKVLDIKTYMTGEFFALLSEKSILSASIERTNKIKTEKDNAFEAGVKESLLSNLLNSSFKVRTNHLFQKFSPQENFRYLSGLLIGTELKELTGVNYGITLVTNSYLCSQYEAAYRLVINGTKRLQIQNADEAMIKGQLKVLNRMIKA